MPLNNINALGDYIALAVLGGSPLALYLAYRFFWKLSAPESAELTRKVLEAQADEEEEQRKGTEQ